MTYIPGRPETISDSELKDGLEQLFGRSKPQIMMPLMVALPSETDLRRCINAVWDSLPPGEFEQEDFNRVLTESLINLLKGR